MIQPINLGQAANDGTGEPLRQGGQKINANFVELDTRTTAAQTRADKGVTDAATAQAKADAAQPKEAGKGLSTNDFTTMEKTKLGGIATGATANSSDATLLNRANHTGQQLASTISNFAAAVLSVALTGLSVLTGTAVIATDSVLVAIGKLQAQLNNLVKVTSTTDGTAGRLLVVGSFGAGGLLPRIEANTIDALRDSGRYYLTAANGPGPTPGGLGVGYLDTIVYASTYAIQWFYTSDKATTYKRVLENNVWKGWDKTDFGMGILVGNALPGGNANQTLPSGKYFVQTAWTGSPFTGTDNRNRGYLEISSWGQDGYQKQEFTPLITAADNPCLYRTSIGAGFRPWETDVNLSSALTDPALTAGGLMYYTSNANGEVFKYANGLMICKLVRSVDFAVTNAATGVFFGQSPTWTFPAVFVGPVPFVPCTHVSGGVITWEVGNIPTLNSVVPAVVAMQSIASRTFTQSLTAIGRWK